MDGREFWFKAHDGRLWKRGLTTGTCAAAAAKAATKAFITGEVPEKVTVQLPGGQKVTVTVKEGWVKKDVAACAVVKDAGDDPDVTDGITIWAAVCPNEEGFVIEGGEGVGKVTKPGLGLKVGEAAINKVPRLMIEESVREIAGNKVNFKVVISVPGGDKIAQKTMNPKVGVVGGISILGTTGIVEPMSDDAFKKALVIPLVQAADEGYESIVMVPGRQGSRWAQEKLGINEARVIVCSNYVGFMLLESARLGMSEVIFVGHIGKLIKLAGGIFNTHSKVADARLEVLAAYAGAAGLKAEKIREILASPTVEAACGIIEKEGMGFLLNEIAEIASRKAREYAENRLEVGMIMLYRDGSIAGKDKYAEDWGIKNGCQLSFM